MGVTVAPGGAWASPISFESLVEGAVNPSDLRASDGVLYWLESRPADGGRLVVSQGMLGWSQATNARRRPSGLGRG